MNDDWATLDQIRDDMRKRSNQLQDLWDRLVHLGRRVDQALVEAAEIERATSRFGRRRPRRRGRPGTPKGPSVVDVALEILGERGAPMLCSDLARAIRSRGVDSGNNERSLRMSAGKGKRLVSPGDDYIALA